MFETERREATILVVDDTPENLTLLNALLKDRYRVKIATGGRKALAMAQDIPPDLVLMDVQMPKLDGLEAMRQIREDADPVLARTPIIALTALAMKGDREKCLAAGANDYISKPIDFQLLLEKMQALVHRDG